MADRRENRFWHLWTSYLAMGISLCAIVGASVWWYAVAATLAFPAAAFTAAFCDEVEDRQPRTYSKVYDPGWGDVDVEPKDAA